jgi:hypothetical protein
MDSAESSSDTAEMRLLKRWFQRAVTDDGTASLRSGFVFATISFVLHSACQPVEISEIARIPRNEKSHAPRKTETLEQFVPTLISNVSHRESKPHAMPPFPDSRQPTTGECSSPPALFSKHSACAEPTTLDLGLWALDFPLHLIDCEQFIHS